MSSAGDPATTLHNLKRKRTRERANAKRFSTVIYGLAEDSSIDDFEHFRGRLQDTLDRLIVLMTPFTTYCRTVNMKQMWGIVKNIIC